MKKKERIWLNKRIDDILEYEQVANKQFFIDELKSLKSALNCPTFPNRV
jgi:hypothetical protein